MIRIENLSIEYKGYRALDRISLNIDKGETVAIVGQNGAGKSTLLKSLVGILQPKHGNINIDGRIGWMSESSTPPGKLKVHEFLSNLAYLKGINKSDISKQVELVIDCCSLRKKSNSFSNELSKGQTQRVLLAGALLGDPEILILDEPSSGLDPLFQTKMIDLIRVVSGNKLLIVSTHNIKEIESLASRIIVLKDGKISFDNKISVEDCCYVSFNGSVNRYPHGATNCKENSFIIAGEGYELLVKKVIEWSIKESVSILEIKNSKEWGSYYDYF